MSTLRRPVGVLLGAGMLASIVALSQVPWTASPDENGELRLAWRWRSQRVQRCRTLTPEELAKLPAHMRAATSCERPLRPWLLVVSVDDHEEARDTVRARGAESDRPLSIYRRVPLSPGRHEIAVDFTPLALPGDSATALPAPLRFSEHAVISPRHVLLVTLEETQRSLVARTSAY